MRLIRTKKLPETYQKGPFSAAQLDEIDDIIADADLLDGWPIEEVENESPPQSVNGSFSQLNGSFTALNASQSQAPDRLPDFPPRNSAPSTSSTKPPTQTLKDLTVPSFKERTGDPEYYEREVRDFEVLAKAIGVPEVLIINKLKSGLSGTPEEKEKGLTPKILKAVSRDSPTTVTQFIESIRKFLISNRPLRLLDTWTKLIGFKGDRSSIEESVDTFGERLERLTSESGSDFELVCGLILTQACDLSETDLAILASVLPKTTEGAIDFKLRNVQAALRSGLISSKNDSEELNYTGKGKGKGKKGPGKKGKGKGKPAWRDPCKFGATCTNKSCKFWHPTKPKITA